MIDTSRTPAMDQDQDPRLDAEEQEFSNEHPLASPNELAGTADAGLELEFAARELTEDAEGAASGIAYEEDTLPLEGN